jgi:uncharacterized membrane protein HdeD (DUF308 family)
VGTLTTMTVERHGPEPEWRAEPPPGRTIEPPPGEDTGPSNRGPLLIAGTLALLAAVVCFVVPAVAAVGTAIFIGIMLLLGSVAIAADAISRLSSGRLWRLLLALLTFAAGVYLLASPLEGTVTLTVILVIWFVGIGIARILVGILELGTPGAGLSIINGAASLVLGVLVGTHLPSAADWAIGLLVGLDFLFFSIAMFGIAWSMPRDVRSSSTPVN